MTNYVRNYVELSLIMSPVDIIYMSRILKRYQPNLVKNKILEKDCMATLQMQI